MANSPMGGAMDADFMKAYMGDPKQMKPAPSKAMKQGKKPRPFSPLAGYLRGQ